MMARRLGGVLLFFVISSALTSVISSDNATDIDDAEPMSCSEVKKVFLMKNIGLSQSVPDRQVKGEDLELCPSGKTCCTKFMEEQYQEAVKKDFRNLLQSSGFSLKTMISKSSSKFRDTFLEMVQVAENSTYAIFSEVYVSMEVMARVPLSQLFADMLAYINSHDVDLEERINSFFDSLFPLAYHHSVNTKHKEFAEAYKECLREVQQEVRPFGDLPEQISAEVIRSFEAARTFLQALHLGVEVLNTTEYMDFGPECRKALVRLTYCPHCQGLLAAKPCAGMCLNVARGCLSSVSELDTSWSEYVSALERLTSGMVGTFNIERVLSSLDTRISETIMYVMENTPDIIKRVKKRCGNPRRVTREVPPSTTSLPSSSGDAVAKVSYPRPSDTSLYMMLQNFVQKLAESKAFYSNVADNLCNDGAGLVVKGDLRCWNGQGLGEYTKTIAGVGVSAQKFNPEMRPPRVRDMTVSTLADKLQYVKQVLTSRITATPQSDSSVIMDGSGSGNFYGGSSSTSDDEDYANGSGSGDHERDGKIDLHFEKSDGNPSVKTSGSTILQCDWCVFAVLVLMAMVSHRRCFSSH